MGSLQLNSALTCALNFNEERISKGQAIFKNKLNACSLRERISRGQASIRNKLNACSSSYYEKLEGNSKLDIHKKYGNLLHGADNTLSYLEPRTANIHIHSRKDNTQLANVASDSCSECEPEAFNPTRTNDSLKDSFAAFIQFIRPFAISGIVMSVMSVSFLSVQRLADLNSKFFIGLLQAIIPAALMNIFVAGVNQLSDIEIDKINKPFLPLASGKFSSTTATLVVVLCLIMSTSVGIMAGSKPLLWAVFCTFVYGIGYSIDWPLLRWKNSAVAAATSISAFQSLVVPIAYFLHMQTHVFGRPAHFPRPILFTIAFTSIFSVVIALFKDIPDMDGDIKHGVKSLTARLGQERVFWICITTLLAEYAGAILVGSFSSGLQNKAITVLGHVALAAILWTRAKSIDVKNKAALLSFYVFIWRLYSAEYLLIPFVK